MWRLFRLLMGACFETLSSRRRAGPLRPGWSFQFEVVVRFLRRDWVEMAFWPPAKMRADLEGRAYPNTMAKKCTRRAERVGGVDGEWFEPPNALADAALIYAHGGSFLAGSSRTHADVIARFALATGLRTFAPNYRLAPEHPWPAAAEDVLAVFRAVVASGVAPSRLAVAGESAGGNLVVKLLLDLRDAKEAPPAAAVSISGWFDLTGSQPSMTTHVAFDYGTKAMLVHQAKLVAGTLALDDQSLSLVHADLSGIGPLLVQTGTAEMLFDECRLFYERARAAGSDVTFDPLPEMPHAAPLLASVGGEGARAIERAARFIVERMG
ncbi:MAG TPA: alpha/beta hydrolase [Polyangiaceae bacterium]